MHYNSVLCKTRTRLTTVHLDSIFFTSVSAVAFSVFFPFHFPVSRHSLTSGPFVAFFFHSSATVFSGVSSGPAIYFHPLSKQCCCPFWRLLQRAVPLAFTIQFMYLSFAFFPLQVSSLLVWPLLALSALSAANGVTVKAQHMYGASDTCAPDEGRLTQTVHQNLIILR